MCGSIGTDHLQSSCVEVMLRHSTEAVPFMRVLMVSCINAIARILARHQHVHSTHQIALSWNLHHTELIPKMYGDKQFKLHMYMTCTVKPLTKSDPAKCEYGACHLALKTCSFTEQAVRHSEIMQLLS